MRVVPEHWQNVGDMAACTIEARAPNDTPLLTTNYMELNAGP